MCFLAQRSCSTKRSDSQSALCGLQGHWEVPNSSFWSPTARWQPKEARRAHHGSNSKNTGRCGGRVVLALPEKRRLSDSLSPEGRRSYPAHRIICLADAPESDSSKSLAQILCRLGPHSAGNSAFLLCRKGSPSELRETGATGQPAIGQVLSDALEGFFLVCRKIFCMSN